jgi:hypothetical protein
MNDRTHKSPHIYLDSTTWPETSSRQVWIKCHTSGKEGFSPGSFRPLVSVVQVDCTIGTKGYTISPGSNINKLKGPPRGAIMGLVAEKMVVSLPRQRFRVEQRFSAAAGFHVIHSNQQCIHHSRNHRHRHEYIGIVMKYNTRNACLQYKVIPLYDIYFISLLSYMNTRWYAPVGATTFLTKNSANFLELLVCDPHLGVSPARVPSNFEKRRSIYMNGTQYN